MTDKIAIVGIGCRLPGASSPTAYWQNLCGGVESIEDLSDTQLLEAGVPAEDVHAVAYVKRAPLLADMAGFDASFFGFTPADAAIADPQQRVFLEVCRDALDDAGLSITAKRLRTGVFAAAGGSVSSYLLSVARAMGDARGLATGSAVHLGNDKDFLSTRASFKLDLRGPSINVQTACSSSIVALHLACQALRYGDCELAMAGASCVRVPQLVGYHASADPILAKDGRCRPFDVRASGTLFGSGAGVVVLRRYADALRDGDNIYALILATGVNNDGGQKVSYTASSVPGQKACIEDVIRRAGVSARAIGYVECHGTATKIGDPLEIKSLSQAFRGTTADTGFCGIGSVKGNIGHLEQAAGIASLIKVALMLRHRQLVPSIHCEQLNPKLRLEESPFYVARAAANWEVPGPNVPRIAGVNCLGMGGTNAFAVLSEAEASTRAGTTQAEPSLFCLSAKNLEALIAYAERFVRFTHTIPSGQCIADLAFTANCSRTEFEHRLALIATDAGSLRDELECWIAQARSGRVHGRAKLSYTCDAEQGRPLRELSARVLECMPDDLQGSCQELREQIMRAVSRYGRECNDDALALLRESGSILECELVVHGWLQHHGVSFDAYQGAGIGALVVQCLSDQNRIQACLGAIAQLASRWSRELAPGARLASGLSLDQLFHAFAVHARAEHAPSEATEPASAGRQVVVRSSSARRTDGHGITLSDYLLHGRRGFASLVGTLFVAGAEVHWDRYYQGRDHQRLSLPTYPYQRKNYWFTDVMKEAVNVGRSPDASHDHP